MSTLLLSLMLILPGQLAVEKSSEPNASNDAALRATVAADAKEFAGRCEFISGESSKAKLVLHPEPILRWSNPTAGQVFGEVFVWTDNGRPTVVGSWYRWFSPDWGRTFEVCSLTESRMTGRLDKNQFWTCDKPGLALKPLEGTDVPAKVAAARLVQMRRIAGDFVARLDDTRGNDSGVNRQLRLLPQPVFRYPMAKEKSSYADGALFAFVEGTDPEAFLLLEAAESNGGLVWKFGLVRMNRDALRITYRDKEVWSAPFIEQVMGRTKEPYSLFTSELFKFEPISK
jgi:hypothetical protein